MIADAGRIAGQWQDVTHAERGHPQQLALQTEHVFVATTQMQERSDAKSLFQHRADREIADAQNRQ